MTKRKFSSQGLLALAPAAIDVEFDRAKPKTELTQALAIVTVRGPLLGHVDPDGHFDSYEGIRQRVGLALASDAPTVVLLIDSPGGLASGCLELSKDLRTRVANAGKRLVAYVDGTASSAAYALACAASKVYVGESSTVGSVGIIDTLFDQTALNRANGLRVEVVASGVRKADGNPNTPMSYEAIEASRARVEQLAATFFELVGNARLMNASKVRALEAGVFMGSEAVRVGLADRVCTFDEMLALVGGKASPRVSTTTKPAQASRGAFAARGLVSQPQPAARGVAHRAPPKPTVSRDFPKQSVPQARMRTGEPTMQGTKAIVDEQRRAFFDKHPDLPRHVVAALKGEPLAKVRGAVAAYESGQGLPPSSTLGRFISELGACLVDPNVSADDRASAQRALETFQPEDLPPALRAELKEMQRIDRLMGVRPITGSKCVSTPHSLHLGVPAYGRGF